MIDNACEKDVRLDMKQPRARPQKNCIESLFKTYYILLRKQACWLKSSCFRKVVARAEGCRLAGVMFFRRLHQYQFIHDIVNFPLLLPLPLVVIIITSSNIGFILIYHLCQSKTWLSTRYMCMQRFVSQTST